MADLRVLMGLLFFPRGGSAQVARYLAVALGEAGHRVSLVVGSLGVAGEETHAPTFFGAVEMEHLDYTAAVAEFENGASAVAAPVPMHPSFEDRGNVPDVVLAAVDPALSSHLASVWERPLAHAGAERADVFHLHHLTGQHDAAARRWPDTPVVAHLHGTEIKFVEAVAVREAIATILGQTLATMPDAVAAGVIKAGVLDEAQREILLTTRWTQWRHGEFWVEHLRQQAARADHIVVVSPPDRVSAVSVLRAQPERVTDVPNGVDTDRFRPLHLGAAQRRGCFRRWLVEDPLGSDESGVPGSMAYGEADLDRLLGADGTTTVFVYVGRFTAAKRLSVLVEAFASARKQARDPMSLLVWGGHPGECEGEHPVTAARRVGTDGIYFAGWRGHEDLPEGLAACDALVMASVNDSYPQTPLEAMATGLPVIATLSGGFPSMVNLDAARPTGWLVAPDDVGALAGALVDASDHRDELAARGTAALAHARANLSWAGRVAGFEHAYERAQDHRARTRLAGPGG